MKLKRVLIIAPHYHTFIRGMIDAVAERMKSARIDVFVHHNYLSELAKFFPLPYFKQIKNFSRERLIDGGTPPENVNVHIVSGVYFRRDSKNVGLGDYLYRKYLHYAEKGNVNFDLIHAHFLWPCGYATVKLGKALDVPVIVTGHGYDVYDLPFRDSAWKAKIKWVLDNADLVTTVSQSNKGILVNKLGVPPEKVEVIPNGFNSKLFKPVDKSYARRVLNLPEDRKIILNVANLVPIKGDCQDNTPVLYNPTKLSSQL